MINLCALSFTIQFVQIIIIYVHFFLIYADSISYTERTFYLRRYIFIEDFIKHKHIITQCNTKKLLGSLYYFLVEHIHRCSLDFSFGGGRSFLGDGSKYPPLGSNNSSVTPNFMSKCFLPPTKSTTENRFMVL